MPRLFPPLLFSALLFWCCHATAQKPTCFPDKTVTLEYEVLKEGFSNEGFEDFVDDTVSLQSDKTFIQEVDFNSQSVYKICLITDRAVDATGFELDDVGNSPLDFTSNYSEIDKNEIIYDFGPVPGGQYILKFKAIKKSGLPSCAYIFVMEKKPTD